MLQLHKQHNIPKLIVQFVHTCTCMNFDVYTCSLAMSSLCTFVCYVHTYVHVLIDKTFLWNSVVHLCSPDNNGFCTYVYTEFGTGGSCC